MAITIDGSSGIASVDGSAGSPSSRGTDANSGVYYAADTVSISTAGTERVRVDSDGDLGLGTSPDKFGSYSTLHIKGPSGEGAAIRLQDNGDTSSSDFVIYKNSAAGYLRVNGTDPLIAYLNGAERLRIDSSGNVGLGIDSPTFGSGGGVHLRGPTGGQTRIHITTSSSGDTASDGFSIVGLGAESGGSGGMINFIQHESKDVKFTFGGSEDMLKMTPDASVELFENGSKKLETTGSGITVQGTVVETSDYRLKENEVAITDGITKVKTLKPYRYNLKEEPTEISMGFFAHEVAEAVPEAVTGLKDAVDVDDNLIPQGIAYSHMVPLLTAALKESVAKIETLEAKVAALEAA